MAETWRRAPMGSILMILLLACATQAHIQDRLANELFGRALKAGSLCRGDLHTTTLAKSLPERNLAVAGKGGYTGRRCLPITQAATRTSRRTRRSLMDSHHPHAGNHFHAATVLDRPAAELQQQALDMTQAADGAKVREAAAQIQAFAVADAAERAEAAAAKAVAAVAKAEETRSAGPAARLAAAGSVLEKISAAAASAQMAAEAARADARAAIAAGQQISDAASSIRMAARATTRASSRAQERVYGTSAASAFGMKTAAGRTPAQAVREAEEMIHEAASIIQAAQEKAQQAAGRAGQHATTAVETAEELEAAVASAITTAGNAQELKAAATAQMTVAVLPTSENMTTAAYS